MASGHTVGLVTGQAFRRAEAEIRQRRVTEASEVDAELSGKGAETVYRDRRGRKLDMLNEFMRQQAQNEGKAVQEKQEQYEWGRGTIQKNNERQFEEELANIKDQPFARHAGDAQLEAMRRQEIRDGDPMAEFMRSKGASSSGEATKPVYKGPPPKPNRFGIRPGYRRDGCDRGTGWEDRLITTAGERKSHNEDAYRYAVSDM